jgi:hypothetical protein
LILVNPEAAHFNPQLSLISGNEQNGAVIESLAADFPLFGHADGILLQHLTFQ